MLDPTWGHAVPDSICNTPGLDARDCLASRSKKEFNLVSSSFTEASDLSTSDFQAANDLSKAATAVSMPVTRLS
jgi:hypothetical protein